MQTLKKIAIHGLILIAAGSILYGYTKDWVAQKELQMKDREIQMLQQQIEDLKK